MSSTGRNITLDDVQNILGRVLVDTDFRKEILKNPEGTFLTLGLTMSGDSMNFFKALNDQEFLTGAAAVEERLGGRPVVALWL